MANVDPKFTKIDGINEVEMNGQGKVTIKNYTDSTFGTFQCLVFLKKFNKEDSVSKTIKLTFKPRRKLVW